MNFINRFAAFFLFLLLPLVALAQDVADKIDSVATKIPSEGVLIVGAAAILEVILRAIKSEKPLSIMHLVARVIRALSTLFDKIADLMDKVLPQRLKK